ncbi:MBL fold metallo-hydrolase [Roseimaritima ulvae]|uniref:Ribonuclease BN n=1 Tax=Roseimaritima ulvae TaxID=980254 RepID=A0A5B9QVG0_9BACT|nr:MBL fold metallo-hydrolase [Roseimaritima ulvae]QEG41365.1 Ribonuclease BN [Roseimaritima ulvae]
MQLHCLGTSGYHPNEQRHTTCYAVPAAGLVLDAGTGMFRLAPLLQTDRLDILLSHAHLDHVVGLTFLLSVLHQRPVETVRVWGQRSKLQAIREHLFHESLFPVQLDVEWIALEDRVPELLGNGRVRWFPLQHPGGSVGYRIDWPDHSLAYVSDTTGDPIADYVSVIRGVDLLLHECNFRDKQVAWAEKTGHSWTNRVASVAQVAAVGQLALVHLNPLETGEDPVGLDSARAVFPNTVVAADKLVLDF